jgi:uncharacterized protein with HXXEE motif
MTFPRLARWGLAVVAAHNAEEAITIPTWLPPRLHELETRFGVRPPITDPHLFYVSVTVATIVPAVWVLLASRAAPRSRASYSILVLYGLFAANALVPHVVGALMLRGYVPGVITAVTLVIPFTIWLCRRAVIGKWASRWGMMVALVIAAIVYAPAVAVLFGTFK